MELCCPVPQLAEQVVHWDQLDHSQSTGGSEKNIITLSSVLDFTVSSSKQHMENHTYYPHVAFYDSRLLTALKSRNDAKIGKKHYVDIHVFSFMCKHS